MDEIYSKYIRSAAWKIKREQYWALNGRYCRACFRTDGPLQVHHLTYERLGREIMSDLLGLCRSCHTEVGKLHRMTGRSDLRAATMAIINKKRAQRRGKK